ncbi:MAG: hypothetical protein IJ326_01565 [Lachnospiraceae bacterium]|nr:hypothetical protein [Lachnospiraceae bacterium]
MEMIYCKKWWFPRKKPIEILNEEIARNNHLNGEDYTVVLKQNDMVSYVVEMAKNDVFVHFMNDNEVNYITYAFHKEHDKLFLNAAYYHNYEEEKEIELMVFGFKENGELCMEKRDLLSGKIEEREALVDVSCNWEDFPEFGNYTKLLILEREKTCK